jgi:hypothetical protein
MKYLKRVALGLLVGCLGLLSVVEVRHGITYGHFVGYGWHVDVREGKLKYGRQNVHTVYQSSLTDFTIHTLTFEAMEFYPGLEFGMTYPYDRGYNELVQRWDPKTGTWVTVGDLMRSQPRAHPNARIRVWPLRRIIGRIWGIETWEGVKEGDTVRIAFLTLFKPEDAPGQHAFYSAPFVVNDQKIVAPAGGDRSK